ncbi:FAD-binding domain-containing protein [Wenzhouxiangella sp. EGI_FJ10409]|uniref:FAD-binding domain-containing protein n=1 Tax=Wenzhouxiangella sp. EGI_FJ10409 TaxID=3243767 RepID=UPI0035E117B0
MPALEFPAPFDLFPPGREAGLERLRDFVPHAGREYAAGRNADSGPGRKRGVSMLSPWIRHRLLSEHEVVRAVLERWAPSTAEKFIQEVFWRSYWKGWLQMRPQVWDAFVEESRRELERVRANAGMSRALTDAEQGRTGIECFDDWARELVATGYLHNHVRMWFASIWIFTLKLPWALGADFFLRHLLDADPASNTLGWRWVAGIQTPGKTYLARADNIEKFTHGRYRPTGLAREAPAIRDERPPSAGELEALPDLPDGGKALLLLHGDDLVGLDALPNGVDTTGAVVCAAGHPDHPWPFGDKAVAFVGKAAADAAVRAQLSLSANATSIESLGADALIERAQQAGADWVLAPEAPVGPLRDALFAVSAELDAAGLPLYRFRRDWDTAAWPLATKGFFPFKKHIPRLLERAGLT